MASCACHAPPCPRLITAEAPLHCSQSISVYVYVVYVHIVHVHVVHVHVVHAHVVHVCPYNAGGLIGNVGKRWFKHLNTSAIAIKSL